MDPERWVDEYGDYLYRYAYSRLRDSNAAEETVQEAFVAGVRYQQQFSGKGSERGWLLGILKRKIIDYVRLRTRHAAKNGSFDDQHDPSNQLFDENGRWKRGVLPELSPDHRMQADELQRVVRDCLSHLPTGQAGVFVLSVMEEMTSEQICQELNITPSNLWVRLHRARLTLAKCVGAKWFETEEAKHVDQ